MVIKYYSLEPLDLTQIKQIYMKNICTKNSALHCILQIRKIQNYYINWYLDTFGPDSSSKIISELD